MRRIEDNWETLKALSCLEDNYNGYGGKRPEVEVLRVAERICERLGGGLQPEIFPLADGGVQLEWGNNNLYIELEVYQDKWLLWSPLWGSSMDDGVEIKQDIEAFVSWLRVALRYDPTGLQ